MSWAYSTPLKTTRFAIQISVGVAKPPDCSDTKHRNRNHIRRLKVVFQRQVPITTEATATTTDPCAMELSSWWRFVNAVVCCVGAVVVVRRLLMPWTYWLGRRALCFCRYVLFHDYGDIGPGQGRAPPACRCCGGVNFDGMAGSWAGKCACVKVDSQVRRMLWSGYYGYNW